MLGNSRNPDRHARARIEQVKRTPRWVDAGAKQRQAMGLRDHEIRRDQRHWLRERLSEEAIGVGMVLIAPAAQRDPRPAIDEQSCRERRRVRYGARGLATNVSLR